MAKLHTTRDGIQIPIEEMDDNHLANTIKFIERRAREGITVQSGVRCSMSDNTDMDYDEETYYGKEALDYLNYWDYVLEQKRRAE